jgi:hypothetical protein
MKLIGIGVLSAGVVLVVGLPVIQERHKTPALYVAERTATTDDIQQFDLMWLDMEQMQKDCTKLGTAEFQSRFLDRTLEFLQFDADQEADYLSRVKQALAVLNEARTDMTDANLQAAKVAAARGSDSLGSSGKDAEIRSQAWKKFRSEQQAASDLLLEALPESPRHALLAKKRLQWLLKLEYSIRESERKA